MPVFDPGSIAGIIANLGVSLVTYAGIAGILYAIGGILIRTVSWTLDNMLINLISRFYDYFEKILGGTIFTESIVTGMRNRVYLIIGVIILFRLGMILIQYIMNPSEVMEEKGGAEGLIKRAVVGLLLMIFIPNIFSLANDLQTAIIKDQVIEKIIMDEATYLEIQKEKEEYGTGRVIGMTVFQGFWNLEKGQTANKNVVRKFEEAEEKYDPMIVEDADYGILHKTGDKYTFSYFPILSTAVLGYVLYLIIKYCIDMVVRLFKLLILEIIAPITITEYIVASDKNEIFKQWRKSVIANYAMLFIRVFTIWFVAYVTYLMKTGVGGVSLLNDKDYLLKTIIILGLLAFMMDFPKMMSDIFGLDLEQDSSVKAVMGKAAGVGMAGLAIGGAVAGAGMKAAGATSKTLKGGIANFADKKGAKNFAQGMKNPMGAIGAKLANTGIGKKLSSSFGSTNFGQNAKELGTSLKESAKENKLGTTLKTGAVAAGAAILASNSVTKSASSGYQQVSGAVDQKVSSEKAKEAEQSYRTQQMAATNTLVAQQAAANTHLNAIAENTEVTATQTVNIERQLGTVSGNIEAIANNTETTAQQVVNIDKQLGTVSGNIEAIAENIETTAQQVVNIDRQIGTISGDVGKIATNTDMIAEDTIQHTIEVENLFEPTGNSSIPTNVKPTNVKKENSSNQ